MASKTIFGWHLDGGTFPGDLLGASAMIGSSIVGPAGFADTLATRMGLGRAPAGQAVRIAKYLAALLACNDGSRFYSKSFQIDAWSTASYLLVLRDELISNGWDGTAIEESGCRIAGLADVERHTGVLNSPAEIMRDILNSLHGGAQAHISHVTLATDLSLLPGIWQQILQILGKQGTRIDSVGDRHNQYSRANEPINRHTPQDKQLDSDLAKVQRFLSAGEKQELSGDASFVLLEADDELQLSKAASAWLFHNRRDHERTVIIRGSGSAFIDAACAKQGLPRIGGHEQSPWRGTMQVLPLALENCWVPTNPLRLLELLSLANSPVHGSIGYHFARALRREPGFGGACWSNAWRDALTAHREFLSEKGQDEYAIEKAMKQFQRELKFWLEPERHSPEVGMPVAQVREICKRVRQWAAAADSDSQGDKTLFSDLISLSKELEEAIGATGYSKITRIQLGRILDAAVGEGVSTPGGGAQAAAWSLVNHPGQIWGSADRILWWNFTAESAATRCFSPWTQAERESLQKIGVVLDTVSDQIAREASAWRQPFLYARKEVLLARPRVRYGEPVPIHPIWHELGMLAPEVPICAIKQQAHELFTRKESKVGSHKIQLSLSESAPLPVPIRNWQVPAEAIVPRSNESASSIQILLGCSMAWVLQYQAQMHQGALLTVPEGEQLIGTIAHAVLKSIFEGDWKHNTTVLGQTAEDLFDKTVDAIGLPLLLPARKVERERARYLIARAVNEFANLLNSATLDVAECEVERQRQFGETHIDGIIDVLLKDKSGHNYVIDYKWSKQHRYRAEEIERGHHIQLATYAWLQSKTTGAFPEAGYYMIRQRRLLFTDPQPFSTAQHVPSVPLEKTWENIAQSYDCELNALTKGEICAAGVSPEASKPDGEPVSQLQLSPPCRFCHYGRICGAKPYANE